MSPAHSTPPEGWPTAAEHFCDDDHQHETEAQPAQITADGDATFTVRVRNPEASQAFWQM